MKSIRIRSFSGRNAGKYRPEKLWKRTLFMQWTTGKTETPFRLRFVKFIVNCTHSHAITGTNTLQVRSIERCKGTQKYPWTFRITLELILILELTSYNVRYFYSFGFSKRNVVSVQLVINTRVNFVRFCMPKYIQNPHIVSN